MFILNTDSLFIKLLFLSCILDALMMKLSTSQELEELQNRRTKLEDESRSLKDEQTNLEQRIRVLEERIAVEELKNNNNVAREAVVRLESKMSELEQRLRQVTQVQEIAKPPEETIAEVHETPPPESTEEAVPETSETMPEEPEEETVTVTALEDSTATQEVSEDLRRRSDKKKRKFF
jgi:TolA-binding protein